MDISEFNRVNEKLINRHPWEIARSRIIYSLLKKQKKHFETIADVGSGDMYVLHELEAKKIADRYFAIDNVYTEELLVKLKKMYEDSAIVPFSDISIISQSRMQPDCFLFLDVLEHCEDDIGTLRPIVSGNLPKGDAIVLITVPAFQYLFSTHDKLLHHYRRYNLKKVTALCEASGLVVYEKGYFFFSLLLLRIFQLFLEKIKIRKPEKSIDNWKGDRWLSAFLSSLLWLDFKISRLIEKIGIGLPGLSCYCICRPSQS